MSTAYHGLISTAYQSNMGLSAALLSQHGLSAALLSLRRAYQHRPNMGLPAALRSLTWANQQRYSA